MSNIVGNILSFISGHLQAVFNFPKLEIFQQKFYDNSILKTGIVRMLQLNETFLTNRDHLIIR